MFIGIRLFFNYPGIFYNSQIEDASNYVLGATDWLSFLGSYLGFAGSLVMAYLVYLQSKFINDITVSEYNPSINMIISLCSKSTDYKEFRDNDIIQSDPNDLNNQYYTFHCAHNNVEQNKYEEFGILIFAEIINTSRISISQLSFLSIEINGTQANGKKFEYVNLGGKWDPADKAPKILPGKRIKRCFFLDHIPREIDISWMTIKFSCDKDCFLDSKVLVSKKPGENLTFLNVSGPF